MCGQALDQFSNTRFHFGQQNTSIKVPLALMSRSLHLEETSKNIQDADKTYSSTQILLTESNQDFPDFLKLSLRSYLQAGYPDLRLAAQIANMSERTLQRRLASYGLSYSELVHQVRFEVAVEMLEDPGIHIPGYFQRNWLQQFITFLTCI